MPNIDPVSQPDLEKLRQQAKEVNGTIRLTHTAEQLWQHFADKNTMSQAVGMEASTYEFKAGAQSGDNRIFVKTKMLGIFPAQYWELPYEWIPPHYTTVERIYLEGPLRYLSPIWQSRNLPDGGCELTVRLRYVGRGFLPVQPVLQRLLQKVLNFHQAIDQKLPEHVKLGFEAFTEHSAETAAKALQLTQQWQHLMPNSGIPAKVAEYIHTVPDPQLQHIRPFIIADYFELPRIDVLRFCLLATRAEYLNMSWDVICPSCNGAAAHTPHLIGLKPEAHCGVCNIRYDANFDQNVEVTFRPTPRVRKLHEQVYCINNPSVYSHLWSQLVLEPGEQRIEILPLPEGEYRLQTLLLPGEILLTSQPSGSPAKISLVLQEHLVGEPIQTHASLHLNLHNRTDTRQVLRIERLRHREIAATAALVTTLQDFRSLFDAEVLRPGLHLGVSNLAVLFSDLKDSTKLYEMRGDASAFSLVQTHFDIMTTIIQRHEGGVVKTIGDAIMAVFMHNGNAVCAALDILRAFHQHNQTHPAEQHIIIKLGIHKGPSIALNMNDKLDYFGSNINRAARVQGQSRGGDLMLSKAMYEDPQVQSCLEKNPIHISDFDATLKGIDEVQKLYCVTLA